MINRFYPLLIPRCLRRGGSLNATAPKKTAARKGYREYVEKGISNGRRLDLVGGGLIRSAGGWGAVKAMRRGMERMKGDERILGDGNFVASALQAARENLESQYELKSKGYGFDWLVGRVALLMNLEPGDIVSRRQIPPKGQNPQFYYAIGEHGELGMTTVALAGKSQFSATHSQPGDFKGGKKLPKIWDYGFAIR